jgi:hypothetical protein
MARRRGNGNGGKNPIGELGRPFKYLHTAHGTAKGGKNLVNAKMINQTGLDTDHVGNRNPGEVKAPRLAGFRVDVLRTRRAHATTQDI